MLRKVMVSLQQLIHSPKMSNTIDLWRTDLRGTLPAFVL